STQHKVTIVRIDDPSTLPLDNSLTADPNDQVIGVDFSGGMASVATQLNTALGSANLNFSASGSTLTVLDDGLPNLADAHGVNALQTRFNDASGVNIDTEMSNLLTLQTAYSANARVMTAIKQMFDMLLNIGA